MPVRTSSRTSRLPADKTTTTFSPWTGSTMTSAVRSVTAARSAAASLPGFRGPPPAPSARSRGRPGAG
ncbi:hypothetical protein [Streptomyces johnsoniae]|uniref:hypothetical protein n=1 Tax=Streptomyces johnsoniae TaxID=3075532 RepID=UPI00374E1C20